MGRYCKPLNEKKLYTLNFKITELEKQIIDGYVSQKNIKNKTEWVVNMIMDKIKKDKTIGLLGVRLEDLQQKKELNILEKGEYNSNN